MSEQPALSSPVVPQRVEGRWQRLVGRPLLSELDHLALLVDAREATPHRVVFEDGRGTEKGEDGVALELVDRAAVVLDDHAHLAEVIVDEFDEF